MDIYVGNLPYEVSEGELQQLFEQHGQVESARVVMDRDTGRSKGFGFVTMNNKAEADAAIAALNGTEVNGRALRVNESQPRPRDNRGGGRGFGGGGGGGGRNRW
jgi:RNA recognition motif-containing protein